MPRTRRRNSADLSVDKIGNGLVGAPGKQPIHARAELHSGLLVSIF